MTVAVQQGRVISFHKLVKRIARRHGTGAATNWVRAVAGYQASIDEVALASAIASGNINSIEAVVQGTQLQQLIFRSVQAPFTKAAAAAGTGSTNMLNALGIEFTFNARHPNVALVARQIGADMVVGIPRQTKQVIAEVTALGAELGLTIDQQARAMRQVLGLPPGWASAPTRLGQEIRAGHTSRATGRRLSGPTKQQIRSRIARGTVDDAFIARMESAYAKSLLNRRALNVARTQALEASHAGLQESWLQAQQQGGLPATSRKFWLVTPDDRLSLEHARIPGMNVQGRGIRESFFTPDGLFPYPPTRTNCRCGVGLVITPARRMAA